MDDRFNRKDKPEGQEVQVSRDADGSMVLLHRLALDPSSSPEARQALLEATHATSTFRHSQVLSVREVRLDDGSLVFVQDYPLGPLLADKLKQGGPLPLPQALAWMRQFADALDFAQLSGLTLSQICPTEFVVKEAEGEGASGGLISLCPPVPTGWWLDVEDAAFASPEQKAGQPCDIRSSLYSAGAVLAAMLTSKRPSGERGWINVLASAKLPPPVTRALLAVLEPDPAKRCATPAEWMDLLDQAQPAPPTVTQPSSAAASRTAAPPVFQALAPSTPQTQNGGRSIPLPVLASIVIVLIAFGAWVLLPTKAPSPELASTTPSPATTQPQAPSAEPAKPSAADSTPAPAPTPEPPPPASVEPKPAAVETKPTVVVAPPASTASNPPASNAAGSPAAPMAPPADMPAPAPAKIEPKPEPAPAPKPVEVAKTTPPPSMPAAVPEAKPAPTPAPAPAPSPVAETTAKPAPSTKDELLQQAARATGATRSDLYRQVLAMDAHNAKAMHGLVETGLASLPPAGAARDELTTWASELDSLNDPLGNRALGSLAIQQATDAEPTAAIRILTGATAQLKDSLHAGDNGSYVVMLQAYIDLHNAHIKNHEKPKADRVLKALQDEIARTPGTVPASVPADFAADIEALLKERATKGPPKMQEVFLKTVAQSLRSLDAPKKPARSEAPATPKKKPKGKK